MSLFGSDAIALQQVVNQLKAGLDRDLKHPLLFRGQLLAVVILLGLASELALKALLMLDTGASAKCHDLGVDSGKGQDRMLST